jgi:hypothetical protein
VGATWENKTEKDQEEKVGGQVTLFVCLTWWSFRGLLLGFAPMRGLAALSEGAGFYVLYDEHCGLIYDARFLHNVG